MALSQAAPADNPPLLGQALLGQLADAVFGAAEQHADGALTFSSTPTQAEAEALRDKCEELADDVRAISGALAQPSLVKVL